MGERTKATISPDQARAMQAALLEGKYSFGAEGQLNILMPKHPQESNREHRTRTRELGNQLREYFDLKGKVIAHGDRMIIMEPNQDMPYILAELGTDVTWAGLASRKGVEVSKAPLNRPSGNAAFVSFAKPEKGGEPASFVEKVEGPDFRRPETVVGKLLLQDAKAEEGPGRLR